MLDSNDILLKLPVIALKKNVMAQNGSNSNLAQNGPNLAQIWPRNWILLIISSSTILIS